MDALSEDVSKESPYFVRGFFDTTKDMKGCKNNVAESDGSYYTR